MESTINDAPQISIDREKTLRGHRRYWVLRRAQDIVFSLLALILLAPLALLISLAIVLDSPGDGAIFRQRRVGRDGKLFWLYKFRTMCPDAEKRLNELLKLNQMDGPVFKIKGDPPYYPGGAFSAQDQSGRTAPAAQCAAGRHEHRGTASRAASGGGVVQRLPAPAAVRHPRAELLLADRTPPQRDEF